MKIAHGTLVLAIDGGKMLLFRNEGDEKYVVLETLSYRESDNPPARELGADAPGRSFSSTGDRRSAYGETDRHDQAEAEFAAKAAEGLERVAASDGARIVVLAPPRMLGQLRKHWGRETKERLLAEIPKDVVHREWDDIARTIEDYRPGSTA